MDPHLRHDEARGRYSWVVDGQEASVMDYRREQDRVVVHHTYTTPAMRGRGIADRLVRAALDDLRARGARIEPTCWFVAGFVDAHPEYQPMLAP